MSALAERIRGIVAPRSTPSELGSRDLVAGAVVPESASRITEILRGEWRSGDEGACLVVETRVAPTMLWGSTPVKQIAERLHETTGHATMVAAGPPARQPFLFVDLETTGLAGGAGTYAFVVGCGSFGDDAGFVIRQFVLTRFDDERPLLSAVGSELARAGALVSFNGKSFDAPLLETRYLFHRLEWVGGSLPHIDVLHPARRFWADGDACGQHGSRSFARSSASGCSLLALERQVLGVRRTGDVPGFEIPARYFHFIRTGDARPLAAILEHNRLDLVSLAGITTRLLQLVRDGAEAARTAHEALALGMVYSRAGLDERACDSFVRAMLLADEREPQRLWDGTIDRSAEHVRIVALRSLALLKRRVRRYDEAARFWEELLDVRGCPAHFAREATEALAIHHEHRVRDLSVAKSFALRSLEAGRDSTRRAAAVRHRLARLDRKLQVSVLPLGFSWPSPTSPTSRPSFGSLTSARRTSS